MPCILQLTDIPPRESGGSHGFSYEAVQHSSWCRVCRLTAINPSASAGRRSRRLKGKMLVVTGTYVDMPVLCTGSLDLKRAILVPPERSGEWVESLGHIANETCTQAGLSFGARVCLHLVDGYMRVVQACESIAPRGISLPYRYHLRPQLGFLPWLWIHFIFRYRVLGNCSTSTSKTCKSPSKALD